MARVLNSPQAFGKRFVEAFELRNPGCSVCIDAHLGLSMDGMFFLGLKDLFEQVKENPKEEGVLINQYLDLSKEATEFVLSGQYPFAAVESRIMPRIYPASILNSLNRDRTIHIPFVNNTVILFVIDFPQMMISVTREQSNFWRVDVNELDTVARDNLSRQSEDMNIESSQLDGGGVIAEIKVGDWYDSSRLLLPELYEVLCKDFLGEFYVAIPQRDVFMAMSCGPEEFVSSALSDVVEPDFKDATYPISPRLFRVSSNGISGT